MRLVPATGLLLLFYTGLASQENAFPDTFRLYNDVEITIDRPATFRKGRETIIIFYALPNGNSTGWTMGKKLVEGDDWHFDIQHIRAQTAFIRSRDSKRNYVVIYLENEQKSWPAWKQVYPGFAGIIRRLVDSLASSFPGKRYSIHLSGHSGGGSFIFGYLSGLREIPPDLRRITFLDSNYGYDETYLPLFLNWFQRYGKKVSLNVFAYNDSLALYQGRPVVSATGGTWYRSRLMINHFGSFTEFTRKESDSLVVYRNPPGNLNFWLKKNLNRGIYHTQQVELNGFIHSVFAGTRLEDKGYRYYGERAYSGFIR